MRLTAFAVLVLLIGTVSATEVYRRVLPDGTVSYSDRPAGELIHVDYIPAPPSSPGSDEEQPRQPAFGGEATAMTTTTDAAPETVPAEPTGEEKAQRCAQARERAERYEISHRLYKVKDNGDREYLNDAEIDAARATAKAAVASWCN
jgi:hypothetical protein